MIVFILQTIILIEGITLRLVKDPKNLKKGRNSRLWLSSPSEVLYLKSLVKVCKVVTE